MEFVELLKQELIFHDLMINLRNWPWAALNMSKYLTQCNI